MRGKLILVPCRFAIARITPADAGKTMLKNFNNSEEKDHPRGCGENTGLFLPRSLRGGSPPRMRGKPALFDGMTDEDRITPADAGKTCMKSDFKFWNGDHPRGCGENFYDGRKSRRKPWITPADAGKTAKN